MKAIVAMRRVVLLARCLIFMFPVFTLSAHEANHDVVPEGEYATANKLGLEGPSETKGVAGVEKLGLINLAEEFPQMEGRQFRAREIIVDPDGVIAIHQHHQRPGIAYILQGEIVEHRSDQSEPVVRKAGDVAIEKTGISHWWENKSGAVVKALVIDIIPVESE